MQDVGRNINQLKQVSLDGVPLGFQYAIIERFDYEWMVELKNPDPPPKTDEETMPLKISFVQTDGTFFNEVDIESFQISVENDQNIYRYYMFPDDKT
ncbi:hypothetical protein [Thalassobacillus pellis]|uniref:hypothetical protein n=1 Tax=Thalassobacillus pellis TaxID=748008 RepID=UPI00195FD24B|nr:hypothetical protein [Thalassobacillus pellis]MBM7551453.1 hypothetical protein [Thalassobacillus pellis]